METTGGEREGRSRTVADTAFSIAAARAEEGQRPPAERLFDDPYAFVMKLGTAIV